MKPALILLAAWSATSAFAVDPGDDVELSSGAVTALSCAERARLTGDLSLLNSCPLSEARNGIVIFDVAEREIYRISGKAVRHYELERAFAGGSIDLTGVVEKVDADGVASVKVTEYSVTPKPKAGSFKGCL